MVLEEELALMQTHLALLVVFEEYLAVASDVRIAGFVSTLCVICSSTIDGALFFRKQCSLELVNFIFTVLVGVVSLLARSLEMLRDRVVAL